jgi:hypothetical protein
MVADTCRDTRLIADLLEERLSCSQQPLAASAIGTSFAQTNEVVGLGPGAHASHIRRFPREVKGCLEPCLTDGGRR